MLISLIVLVMKIIHLADQKILEILGERFRAARLSRDMSVAMLAENTGLAAKTIQNLENGNKSVGLLNIIAILRVLDMLDELDNFLPTPPPRVTGTVKTGGRRVKARQRASRKPKNENRNAKGEAWTWGDA